MTFELQFLPSALKEWKKLGATVREQFKAKLAERQKMPHVPGSALSGMPGHYKIKLRSSGYRLVYRVDDQAVTITVVAAGRRDGDIYEDAQGRTKKTTAGTLHMKVGVYKSLGLGRGRRRSRRPLEEPPKEK